MCYRLLAALRAPDDTPVPADRVETVALAAGLDARAVVHGGSALAELALGDCACQLYTGRGDDDRIADFVDRVHAETWALELLVYDEDAPPAPWGEDVVLEVPAAAVRARGLSALPDARVTRVRRDAR